MKSRIKTQPSQPHAEHGDNGEKPAGESAKLSELLDRIEQFHFRYIVFPNKHAAVVVALFVPHTWTFEAFDCTPYLHLHSPVKECGKTRRFPVPEASLREVVVYDLPYRSGSLPQD